MWAHQLQLDSIDIDRTVHSKGFLTAFPVHLFLIFLNFFRLIRFNILPTQTFLQKSISLFLPRKHDTQNRRSNLLTGQIYGSSFTPMTINHQQWTDFQNCLGFSYYCQIKPLHSTKLELELKCPTLEVFQEFIFNGSSQKVE